MCWLYEQLFYIILRWKTWPDCDELLKVKLQYADALKRKKDCFLFLGKI